MKSSPNPLARRASVTLERAAKEHDAPIWGTASKAISAPSKNRVEVNIARIARVSEQGQALFVPGKVLGSGTLDKKVTVGAFSFSTSAKSKIEASGGSALTVAEFIKKYPDGGGVKLVE